MNALDQSDLLSVMGNSELISKFSLAVAESTGEVNSSSIIVQSLLLT